MTFHDHFSGHAADYARFRPAYPAALFDQLAAYCDAHHEAWDCGTGSGQAARSLADRFDHVTATDASPQQLAEARPHPRITYRVAPETSSGLADGSIDLVTVAQALHWFDTGKFFAEVRRVLKPNGVIAVWCYGLCRLGQPFDPILERYYSETVGDFWPAERVLVEQGYRNIDFPFAEFPPPNLVMESEWSLDGLLSYLGTWSATKRFEEARGYDPLPALKLDLLPTWGDPQQQRLVSAPLSIRVGLQRRVLSSGARPSDAAKRG